MEDDIKQILDNISFIFKYCKKESVMEELSKLASKEEKKNYIIQVVDNILNGTNYQIISADEHGKLVETLGLTEGMRSKIPVGNETRTITSASDIVLVHRTDYIPKYDIINSTEETGREDWREVKIGGKTYEVYFQRIRNSIHFATNGEVGDHMGGKWSTMKYTIMIPFQDIDKNNIEGGKPYDLFTKKGVNIPKGSFILCPENEAEHIRNLNQNLQVIGYKGKDAHDYDSYFIGNILGMKVKINSSREWKTLEEHVSNANDASDEKEEVLFYEILNEFGITYRDQHTDSLPDRISRAKINASFIGSLLNLLNTENIELNQQTYNDFVKLINNELEFLFSNDEFDPLLHGNDTILNLYKVLEGLNIEIPIDIKQQIDDIHNTLINARKMASDSSVTLPYVKMIRDVIIETIKNEYLIPKYKQQILSNPQSLYDDSLTEMEMSFWEEELAINEELHQKFKEQILNHLHGDFLEEITSFKENFSEIERRFIMKNLEEIRRVSTSLLEGTTSDIMTFEGPGNPYYKVFANITEMTQGDYLQTQKEYYRLIKTFLNREKITDYDMVCSMSDSDLDRLYEFVKEGLEKYKSTDLTEDKQSQGIESALGDCLSDGKLRSGQAEKAIEAVNIAIRSETSEISIQDEIDEDEQAE